eukprot:3703092-Rhodomonas_salina.1
MGLGPRYRPRPTLLAYAYRHYEPKPLLRHPTPPPLRLIWPYAAAVGVCRCGALSRGGVALSKELRGELTLYQ